MSLAKPPPLHIVGVGASAGGLEAMLPMFAQMPTTGRLTYVVAQHMAKDGHDELVVRLINRESALPAVLAQTGDVLKPDTVYVLPSGQDGRIEPSAKGDCIALQAAAHLSTPSVNALFTSIADRVRGRGIGIVLSGTGSDGVIGCRALKAQGGWTLAQAADDAKFDGMPTAAITAKVIDDIFPATAMGAALARRFPGVVKVNHGFGPVDPATGATTSSTSANAVSPALTSRAAAPPSAPVKTQEQLDLAELIALVHKATRIDFSSYKEDTLMRRLEKRIDVLGLKSMRDYLALARKQPEELHAIQHLFLVSVSSFYRDRESFAELERALAGLLAGKARGDAIRIWVAACASGEEPYTLAMILCELLGEHRAAHPIQIVGTDLNPEALALARAGRYRNTACKEMDAEVQRRYLIAHGQHVEVQPWLREMVHFEQRDVLTGAPAALTGKLDLVTCRNLLIYMKSELQDELIKSFYQALRPQCLLFIGQSESLSFVGNSLFVPIDHYHRLFRRRH